MTKSSTVRVPASHQDPPAAPEEEAAPNPIPPVFCPTCAAPRTLDLTQPEEGDFRRLLGICPGCSRWYFHSPALADGEHSITLDLPVPSLRSLEAAARAARTARGA